MYSWKDKLARTEDESVMYVLPNHMMLKIDVEEESEESGVQKRKRLSQKGRSPILKIQKETG